MQTEHDWQAPETLAVPICANRATLCHDPSDVICATRVSFNQNKFAVMQGGRVTFFDHVRPEIVIGKMCFKSADDTARSGLDGIIGFRIVPECSRRL